MTIRTLLIGTALASTLAAPVFALGVDGYEPQAAGAYSGTGFIDLSVAEAASLFAFEPDLFLDLDLTDPEAPTSVANPFSDDLTFTIDPLFNPASMFANVVAAAYAPDTVAFLFDVAVDEIGTFGDKAILELTFPSGTFTGATDFAGNFLDGDVGYVLSPAARDDDQQVIPLPAPIALTALGVAALAGAARKRRRA